MRRDKEENEKIKKQAGEHVVVVLQNWKSRMRRRKVYKTCLMLVLAISCTSLTGVVYYEIDSSVPSVINLRAGEEESFRLGVPAKAEIVSVSDSGKSNIPKGAVDIDLSKTVTMKMAEDDAYKMQVKLFGFLPFKQVGIRVIEDRELIPVGMPIGIYVKTEGVLVVGTGEFQGEDGRNYSPGKNILHSGDYIHKINGVEVDDKDELIDLVEECGGKAVTLTVERNDEMVNLQVKPEKDTNGEYKMGVWVRDSAQGVGTMTYLDNEGNFGALGHGINDVDTSTLMQMEGGALYETSIVDIKKGAIGNPGEMTGMIVYSNSHMLGSIDCNSTQGIFGSGNSKAVAMGVREPLPIGLKQELEKGPAQILCCVEDTAKYYSIEITKIHLDNDNVNRGIELKVTDQQLLGVTGGIVQGMFTSYNGSNNRKARKIKGFLMF